MESGYNKSARPWGPCHSTCYAEHLVIRHWPGMAGLGKPEDAFLTEDRDRIGTSQVYPSLHLKTRRPLCTCPRLHR